LGSNLNIKQLAPDSACFIQLIVLPKVLPENPARAEFQYLYQQYVSVSPVKQQLNELFYQYL